MGITLDRLEEIKIVDNDGDVLAIDGSGFITANINGTVTVSATDLDIRGLNVATDGDHVYLTDSTGANALAVAADGSIAITDNGGSLTVDGTVAATQSGVWDIGTLTSITNDVNIADGGNSITVDDGGVTLSIDDGGGSITVDGTVNATIAADADDAASVENPINVGGVVADVATALSEISAAGDRFHLLGDMYRRLLVRDAADVAWQTAATTVGLTAVELAATPLNGRGKVIIQNNGSQSIFVGQANTVTTANGIEISKNSSMEFPFGEALNLWAISGTAGQDVRVLEAA